MEKLSLTPTSGGAGAAAVMRKGSGGAIIPTEVIDQLQADQDQEYRKNFSNRKFAMICHTNWGVSVFMVG